MTKDKNTEKDLQNKLSIPNTSKTHGKNNENLEDAVNSSGIESQMSSLYSEYGESEQSEISTDSKCFKPVANQLDFEIMKPPVAALSLKQIK